MTFLPECGADKSLYFSRQKFFTHQVGSFHVCQICWNDEYKDLEQVYLTPDCLWYNELL